jgi:hypothetical protein
MTMPIETIRVRCPHCQKVYKDWYRDSINLDIDNFDDDYIDQCSSATCPKCGHKVYFDNLVVKNGVFIFKVNELIPKAAQQPAEADGALGEDSGAHSLA